MTTANISDFIDTYAAQKDNRARLHGSALVVLPKRYGPGTFVAFLSLGSAPEANNVALNLAQDKGYEKFLQDCDWFPYGMGDTVYSALAMLDARVAKIPRDFEGFDRWLELCKPIWTFFSQPMGHMREMDYSLLTALKPR